jgi:hypothetical protein
MAHSDPDVWRGIREKAGIGYQTCRIMCKGELTRSGRPRRADILDPLQNSRKTHMRKALYPTCMFVSCSWYACPLADAWPIARSRPSSRIATTGVVEIL